VSTEPKRLSKEPTALGASVAAFREQLPPEDRIAALAARLSARGAHVESHPTAPTPATAQKPETPDQASAPNPASGRLKWFVLGALLLGGGGLLVSRLAAERDAAVHAREPASGARVGTEGPTQNAAPMAAPSAPDVSLSPTPPARTSPDVPRVVAGARATQEEPAAELSSGSAPSSVVSPSAPAVRELVHANPPASDASSAAARRPAHSSSDRFHSPPTDTNPSNPGAPLAESTVVPSELELLKQARSALDADPARAFAITERCRAQYPSGELAQEREYVAISALVRLGRSSEASSRAALFRMHYPSSAYVAKLSRLLGEP